MANTSGKKKPWAKIGTLRKGQDGSYIKLEANVEVYVDGVKIDMNDKKTVRLEDPRRKVEGLHERGFIDEAEKDKRLEKLAELDWLRYELIVPPPRT